MKTLKVDFSNIAKNIAITAPLLLDQTSCFVHKNQENQPDVFVKQEPAINNISSRMEFAPEVEMGRESVLPMVVVDLSKNKLYHYDFCGILDKTYSIYPSKKNVNI